jgi:multiple sugar transport system ATP-binding protein
MASLRIRDLVKSYGGARVLHGVDLDVADGEFVVLVGPSGCGKSTLLRMIAGLDDVSSGEMWIGERLSNSVPPQRRNIAMVFQSYALFPHMSVAGNVGFGPRIRREAPPAIANKVAKAAATLNLSDYLERFPRQLSGGQRQRVAMGRAIVRQPDLFLFDEPLSNLDAKLRVQMRTEIKALHQTVKTTIVYVTHDQIEAMTMADRIVVMNAGRIEQIGAPLDLYDRPVNRFVAGFLGSPAMSFVPGVVERGDGPPRVRAQNGLVIPIGETSATSGQAVEVGVRPEHFELAPDGKGMPFEVMVVEPTGAETLVFGFFGGAEARCVLRQRIQAARGEALRLSVDPAHIHLFDAATGARLS